MKPAQPMLWSECLPLQGNLRLYPIAFNDEAGNPFFFVAGPLGHFYGRILVAYCDGGPSIELVEWFGSSIIADDFLIYDVPTPE